MDNSFNGTLTRQLNYCYCERLTPYLLNTPEEAKKVITAYVFQYNEQRLHSSIGYVTPLDTLNGEAVVTMLNARRS